MNSKLGTIVSTILVLGSIFLGAGSALASEADDLPVQDLRSETRAQAEDANRAAVSDAVNRMRDSNRIDLDIELPGRTSAQTAGD